MLNHFIVKLVIKHLHIRKTLSRHRYPHTGDYIREICGKCLTGKDELSAHERIHTGEIPFSCGVCGKSYRYKHDLTAHNTIHTGKQHNCDICGKHFNKKKYLIQHIKGVHMN